MGIYPSICPLCHKPFMWFSGNAADQRCGECKKEKSSTEKFSEMNYSITYKDRDFKIYLLHLADREILDWFCESLSSWLDASIKRFEDESDEQLRKRLELIFEKIK